MKLLHLSNAVRSTVTALLEKGAPVIPEQRWSTYPCSEPHYDGLPISFDQETDDAIRAAIALSADQGLVTVMLPVADPGPPDLPKTLHPGFTVVADENGQLFLFQCVLVVKGLDRFNDMVVDTPRARFMVVDTNNVTAWDKRGRGHPVRVAG